MRTDDARYRVAMTLILTFAVTALLAYGIYAIAEAKADSNRVEADRIVSCVAASDGSALAVLACQGELQGYDGGPR